MQVSMRIVYCSCEPDADVWVPALRAALPGADVFAWAPGAPAADYAVVWKPPQQLFDEQTQLKAVFITGAGVDALLKLRLPAQVPLVRLDDAGMAVQMAEYACHALIGYFRGFDAYAADARAGIWRPRPPQKRMDFPVGIMGLGVLGQRVAQAVAQFDFPVLGWSRTPKAVAGVQCYAGPAQLADFLAATRVLVCLLPMTDDTRDILCHRTLSLLRPSSYLINVARGAHVVEEDLLALLDDGHLAGATLDVVRTEPLPPAHPLWSHPKVTLTPHISAITLREQSIAQIAQKLVALQSGATVAGLVDTQRGY